MKMVLLRFKSGIILLFFFSVLLLFAIPVLAATFEYEETSLYEFSKPTSIQIGPDGTLFMLDDSPELWAVNGDTGEYVEYYPLGSENLADISFSSATELWWANNVRGFGKFTTGTAEVSEWYVNNTGAFNEDLQLGPILSYNEKIWLPTWFSSSYGLFQFDPTSKDICLYPFSSGLYAADIAELDGKLWILDWRDEVDDLYSFNPANGNLIRYSLNRNLGERAFLFVENGQLWWAEDQSDGGIGKFVPGTSNQGELTVYDLPAGSYPRNLFVENVQVWYSDLNGAFGHLNTGLVSGNSSTITGTNLGTIPISSCENLGPSDPYPINAPSETFTWMNQSNTVDNSNIGLEIYDLPDTGSGYGITLQNDYVWVTDAGRQKLIRMPFVDVLPEISVLKSASQASVPIEGGDVTYSFTVTNSGSEEVEITSLSDDKFGNLTGDADCQVGTKLAAGTSCSFEEIFTVPSGSYPGSHVNVFTAEVKDPQENTDSASDDEVVTYTQDGFQIFLPLLLK